VLASVPLVLLTAVAVWTFTPAVIATNVPSIPHGALTPLDMGLVATEVTVWTSDGVQLWAWYVPSQNGAAVVLRHGAGATASSTLRQASVLARNGYGVLIIDARGHGRSAGRAMDFGWHGESDIDAAVTFLLAQSGVDSNQVAVIGLSMGGEEAIAAAGADPRIRAVVAEGALARSDLDKAWLPDVYGLRGVIQVWLEKAQYGLTDLLTDATKPLSLVQAARMASLRPILLIAAGDVADEVHAAEHIREGGGDNVTIWIVPGSGHTEGLDVAPNDWEQTVIEFLESALVDE
jgi:pimeloyl-ACP methyl ester carboxylesterase